MVAPLCQVCDGDRQPQGVHPPQLRGGPPPGRVCRGVQRTGADHQELHAHGDGGGAGVVAGAGSARVLQGSAGHHQRCWCSLQCAVHSASNRCHGCGLGRLGCECRSPCERTCRSGSGSKSNFRGRRRCRWCRWCRGKRAREQPGVWCQESQARAARCSRICGSEPLQATQVGRIATERTPNDTSFHSLRSQRS